MRNCKTTVVIGPRKSGFCGGIPGRILDKSVARQKRWGLTIVISKERPVNTIQKHEKPSVFDALLM
jgi:hypothetical protein